MPAAALSSSNRTQLGMKLEGTYPTNFGVPQGGNGALLNMLSESLNYDLKNEQSKQLRSDRGVADLVQVGASAQGGFAFEQQFKEYDTLIEAVMQSAFVAYGTGGVSTANAFTLTATATTLTASTAPTSNDAFTLLQKSDWFTIIPVSGASAAVKAYLTGRAFRISSTVAPTSTVITLDSATPVDTAVISAALAAGWRISCSRLIHGNTMKSYTLEVQHADVNVFRQYSGMIPSKMDMKIGTASIVTGSFDFMGKGMALLGTTSMGSPTAPNVYTPANGTKGVFDIFEGGVSLNATTYIKSCDISIDNALRIQDAVGVFGAAGIGAGTMNVTAKLQVYLADAVMYNKLLSGAASSLSIPVLDIDGNGYIIFFPKIKYSAAKVATGGQDQDNMLDVDVQALPDTTAGSQTLGKWVVIYRCGI